MNLKASLLLLLTGAATVVISAEKVSDMRLRQQAFMKTKLVYSQAILEGLTLEKYDLVSKNALRMRNMSQEGDWFLKGEWFLKNNPDYKAAITNFYRQTDSLFMAAADKNLDTAKEAYKKVVDSCVSCHVLFRAEQMKKR
ncbi:MAG: cytochrome c [Verrucomicrobiales bacterium]|nr:cytochrome c [Verrucomicrobiales bacterium]